MINIKTWVNNKPIVKQEKGYSSEFFGGENQIIPVTKIKCDNHGKIQYTALVHKPEINASHNYNDTNGETWIRFYKSDNKQHKIPVLNHNQIIEV